MRKETFNTITTSPLLILKQERYKRGDLVCFNKTKTIALFEKDIDKDTFKSFCSINGRDTIERNKIFKKKDIKGKLLHPKNKEVLFKIINKGDSDFIQQLFDFINK